MSYFWIIGGGILQIPLIKEAKNCGYTTIVTDGNKNCICSNIADHFFNIDIFNYKAHIQKAEELLKKRWIIKGVLAAGIDAPETMTQLAEFLNLPSVGSDIANLVNNKDKFRQKMKEINIDVPKFEIIDNTSIKNLSKIIQKIQYPLIVKNTSSSGSRGTKIFYKKNNNEVKEIVKEAIFVSRSKKALIESLWEGSEHTVETLFDCNGNFHFCFITDRHFDKTNGFALETALVHPTRLTETHQNEMIKLAKETAEKIGITQGAAKYDMMLTNDGPKIIEMTVRLSGGFDCQYLVPCATGKNILKAAILTATGNTFKKELLTSSKNKVALSESLWPKPGKIIKISGIEEAKKCNGFEHIFFRYNIGDTVQPYIDCTKRVCFIIATGSTYDDAKNNINKIKETIKIETK